MNNQYNGQLQSGDSLKGGEIQEKVILDAQIASFGKRLD